MRVNLFQYNNSPRFVNISVVFAFSVASSTRVGNLLGAQQPHLAKTAAWLSVYLSTLCVLISALCIYYGHDAIGKVFTSDEAVVERLTSIAPTVAAFQLAYGLQGIFQGCLRGLGHQLSLAGFNFKQFEIF